MGAPRTILDGGQLLRTLDHNNDGQIDQLEAQQLARGAAVVSLGQFESSLAAPGEAAVPTVARSCGSLHQSQLFASSPSLSPKNGRFRGDGASSSRRTDD